MDYQTICAFLYKEARHLDDREWEEWLDCYSKDAEYWMPCWDDNDQPTTDPKSQVSLIYYPNRCGLEDRVFRIQTERSSASTPEPRTNHMLTNIEVLAENDGHAEVRYNFQTLSHRYRVTDHYFGTVYLTLAQEGEELKIKKKKVILKNDYIRQVVDVYHI